MSFVSEKKIVTEFFDALEKTSAADILKPFEQFCASDYQCFSSYPWRLMGSKEATATGLWQTLKASFSRLQRRQDIFFAGLNEGDGAVWVVSMGHFMGLFDAPWLGVKPTHKISMLRYAEFNCVVDGKITQSGIFFDLLAFFRQSGIDLLPNETGNYFVYPGPRTHDGLQTSDADPAATQKTSAILNQMIADLDKLNHSGDDRCPPELLAKTWHEDMTWYGPAGIGASYTIPRYQLQHQYPFREGLKNKKFNGHVCRVAEGNYAGFFGWPNLTNSAAGGFLGLPANEVKAEMQVVDIYRREGDKLMENWVIIDFPYWLMQQGLDLLKRAKEISSGE